MIIHCYIEKQRKIEFKPRTKLNTQHSIKRNGGGEVAKEKKENNETMTKAALPSFLHHISFEFSRKKNYALNLSVKVFSTKYLVCN